MSQRLRAVVCASLLFLAGCAAKAPKPPAEPPPWTASGACVSSLADLHVTAMVPGTQALWRGDFRSAAACLERASAVEPVILLALDTDSAQQELDVFLHIGKDYLLGAAVSVLDAAYQPLRRYAFDDFTARGSYFSLRLFPQWRRAAAFVLVEIDREAYGGNLDRVTGQRVQSIWMAGGYMGTIADGVETQQRIAIRDTGELSLHRVAEVSAESNGGRRGREKRP